MNDRTKPSLLLSRHDTPSLALPHRLVEPLALPNVRLRLCALQELQHLEGTRSRHLVTAPWW